jgi:hexulose-6-phosphate isomerase
MNRRTFLSATSGAAASLIARGAGGQPAAGGGKPKKAVMWSMLPRQLSVEDRLKLARDVGFAGVETPPVTVPGEAEKMRGAAEAAGIRIHSVIYGGWDPPLTHPEPAAREQSVRNAEAALRSAKLLGADNILLVPGVVDGKTRYTEAYERAREGIQRLVPHAQSLRIRIDVEEVWNNFLLSPLEYVRFIDSFQSEWVQAYFDVGNVVPFGWPEDWIRTAGKRIRKVHLKDFKGGPGLFGAVGKGAFVNLGDGSVNWIAVRQALAEVGFTGFATTELGPGDEAYLRDVSARVDRLLLA